MTDDPTPTTTTTTTTTDARPDRLLDLGLRAFPPRWRREYGAELLELSADLRSERASHRLAEAAGLVRGGWAVRLRNRPPLRAWLAYRLLERPLPVQWHGWMRDDLEGRRLGLRLMALRAVPLLLIWAVLLGVSVRQGDGLDRSLVGPIAATVVVALIIDLTGWPARRLRRTMWTKAGYTADGSRYLVPPPPVADDLRSAAEFLPWGRPRHALAPLALPFGGWAVVAGLAAMLGATSPDEPFRLGALTARRDPNSPLDRPTVLFATAAALAVAAVAGVVAGRLAGRRVLAAPRSTIHALAVLSVPVPVYTAAVSVVGACLTGAGAAGIWPDQAATALGAIGVVGGSVLVCLALVARRHGERLGRPVTLGDLTMGEQVVMLPVPAVTGSTR